MSKQVDNKQPRKQAAQGYRKYGSDRELMGAGLTQFDQGEYQQAVATLTQLLARNPTDRAFALYYRGWANARLDNFDAAMADFRAISFPNSNSHVGEGCVAYSIACMYALMHQPVDTMEQLAKVVAVDDLHNHIDQARTDSDFEWLLTNDPEFSPRFRQLVNRE